MKKCLIFVAILSLSIYSFAGEPKKEEAKGKPEISTLGNQSITVDMQIINGEAYGSVKLPVSEDVELITRNPNQFLYANCEANTVYLRFLISDWEKAGRPSVWLYVIALDGVNFHVTLRF